MSFIKKRSMLLMSVFFAMALVLVGCGDNENAANPMSYIGIEDVKEDIESGAGEFILLDNRKAEDYEDAHITGAIMADVDAANKGGDDDAGIASLEAALLEATGNAAGDENAKYALLCYSGKSYAQKATDLLIEMGVDPSQIYTMEGGMSAWNEGGDEYADLLE